jgi:hypothetical protein
MPYGLDPVFTSWDLAEQRQVSFSLAAPLSPRHSFQLGVSARRGEVSTRREILEPIAFGRPRAFVHDGESTDRRLEARWIYDTTDHPLLPTRGLSLSVGLEAAALAVDGQEAVLFAPDFPGITTHLLPAFEAETVAAVAAATRHWPVTARQTVSATARASVGHSWLTGAQVSQGSIVPLDREVDVLGGSLGVRHAVSFWRSRQPDGFSDLRLETTAELGAETTSPALGLASTPLERFEASTALVYRTVWGRLRFQLSYLDLGEVLP